MLGRIEAERYLSRVLPTCPYGLDSRLRHIVGGNGGGGFEWTADATSNGIPGITAIEVDDDGVITRVSSTYDSRQLDPDHKASLARAAI